MPVKRRIRSRMHKIMGAGLWDDFKSGVHKIHHKLQDWKPVSWIDRHASSLIDSIPHGRTVANFAKNVLGYRKRRVHRRHKVAGSGRHRRVGRPRKHHKK